MPSRWLAALLALGMLLSAALPAAQARDGRRPAKHKQKQVGCPKGDSGCETDRKVRQVEEAVSDYAASAQQPHFWDISQDLDVGPSKHPVVRKIFMGPTYAMRALTFPFALLADLLIRKGVVEKVVDAISNDERTFWVYPRLELGFGSGFGGGIGLLHTDLGGEGYRFNAGYLNHIDLDQSGWASLAQPDAFRIAGRPVGYRIAMNVLHDKNAEFYGVGAGTPKDDRSYYQIDNGTVGGELGYQPIDHFWVALRGYFSGDAVRPGSDTPSVETMFPAASLPGFDDETPYADVGFVLSYDTRDEGAAPERGMLARATFERFQGLGVSDRDFNQYGIEVLQLLRLWLPRHVLALRTAWVYQQVAGDDAIPFNRLATLDVNTPERGLPYGRFRDRGSMVFNVEYRYPVWQYADGSFFFDFGRVFHDLGDISFKDLAYAGGLGFRVRTRDFFLFRTEVAFGNDGVRFLFRTSSAF